MKYMKQLCIIMAVAFAGEVLKALLPFPIPASIYGLVLMLVLLISKVLPLSAVEETADFLVSIMPVMFIPAAVALMDSWSALQPIIIPALVTIIVTNIVVMVVTGLTAQTIIRKQKGGENA